MGETISKQEVKTQPVYKVNARDVACSVWENEPKEKDKSKYFTITAPVRSYKDSEGNWKKTSSLRVNDLSKARICLSKCEEFCLGFVKGD